ISDLLKGGTSKEKEMDKSNEKEEDSNSENDDADSKKDSDNNKSRTTETSEALPKDVTVVTMPRLSDTMEEGTVATWLKKVGDDVKEGDILAEIETDKATMEFEAFQAGTLLFIGLKEGESAKVDELLAIIGPKGTDVSSVAKNFHSKG